LRYSQPQVRSLQRPRASTRPDRGSHKIRGAETASVRLKRTTSCFSLSKTFTNAPPINPVEPETRTRMDASPLHSPQRKFYNTILITMDE
jgi:hypothetical protein